VWTGANALLGSWRVMTEGVEAVDQSQNAGADTSR